ncbi:imm11 family protein [Archangium violaceum]|uniref:imm11 family protein n=1 Tax=Archangium violaceum TaxID=83451 RepID=UPI0036DA1AEC
MSRYFKLRDHMSIPGRWVLDGPFDERGTELDSWQFGNGQRIELACVPHFTLAHVGGAVDFSQTGLGVPVVHGRVAAILERLAIQDVQLLPARVEGQTEPWFILNVLRIIRCIDDARCGEVEYWKPEDGQPEKVGQYSYIHGLKVDPAKVGDAHIFRPWGWDVAIIVSDTLKQALEQERITGMKYIEA